MGMKERKEPKMTFKDLWNGDRSQRASLVEASGNAKFICSIVSRVSLQPYL